MEEFLLVARNITQAQHMAAVLSRGGLRAGVLRTPSALSESGCSHAVRLRAQTAARALGTDPLEIPDAGLREIAATYNLPIDESMLD